ncbi:cytochrome bc1 complex cytochrome b subunit [Nocardioides sp. T2.26MG-1]|uniref:cytochrome bc1 complex cytochrome b subunit n=1 Tax=Nocardioides sp. T2.26MG-1 TaxID=3041166 RepID=UPI0024773207|nr:ubiquinol-cytochrome c reductase cytochrome b subunit [Nocardioides sp. T2.26MG-1]CAI9403003.1 Cytochrome bc1 complex cytochrome b subunit [Nocardioides sp. T2.26MG-1]
MPSAADATARVASTNGTEPATPSAHSRAGTVGTWADERLGLAKFNRRIFSLRKVFPDHWSFLFGELALWSFTVLLVTGIFLTFWFDPSMAETRYQGSYEPLRGIEMSRAFASTLEISFDVRGGLLIRQIHHWSAHIFIAAMLIHLVRHALTGSFRKPREVNWVVGCTMLLLGTLEGFFGYSLPDDLLSGTGLRALDGFLKATPVVGTYLSFLTFGGEFPGDAIISRLYIFHVLLIPGLLLALVAVHLILVVYHKHTQWPGPGRTNGNVVGYPFFPVYMAKAGGFFLIVFGVLTVLGALVSINPVWKYGPYDPSKITAGVQPDWYMGWPDGLLRIMPGLETHLFGEYTISWNILLPILVAPPALLLVVTMLPFVEAWVTGDKQEHHLLQRPRDAATRTAFVVSLMTFYGIAWAAGGNDIIAIKLHLSINEITYALRVLIVVGPPIAFAITKRWCIALQRADRDRLVHGVETGVIVRSPSGGYSEAHRPLPRDRAYILTAHGRPKPIDPPPKTDLHGIPRRGHPTDRLRHRLSELMFADNVDEPAAEEVLAARRHPEGDDREPAEHTVGSREAGERHAHPHLEDEC